MQLTSISFLFYFLPLFLAVYYITPEKERALVTLIGSVLFFVLQDGIPLWQVLLALGLTGAVFLVGVFPGHRVTIPLTLGVMASMLVCFKCYDGGRWLPVGMSFYLFQMAAYLIDIRRKRLEPETNLVRFGTQILMFPKLLSGPLVEPQRLKEQVKWPRTSQIRFHSGLQELVLGLSLKVLVADRVAGLWDQAWVIGVDSLSWAVAWGALIAFALRLYLDFHGYSLMAVGLGKMLGFELPHNFDEPYSARSVSDFYRRWHRSLTGWFRNYVYIPLGGNRNGKLRMIRNVLAVWILTGAWHGNGGNYLLWGLILGTLIINEKLWLGRLLEKMPIGSHVYTIFAVLISWIPFAIGDWGQMWTFVGRLFSVGSGGGGLLLRYFPIMLIGILFATPVPGLLVDAFRDWIWFDIILFVLFWFSVYQISTAPQDPFLYFKF